MKQNREQFESRRKFLKRAIFGVLGIGAATLGYTFLEAKWCRVVRETIRIPHLPKAFRGFKVALLSDIHHGPFVPLFYVRHVVDMTNELEPDTVMLCGDYVHRSSEYIEPCIGALGGLKSRHGSFAVLGNHDHWEDATRTRKELRKNNIEDLTNRGVWLARGDSRIRVCGVGDYWEDTQDLNAALGDAGVDDSTILMSHNPDYVDEITDKRVGLVLSGHTHGGQVVFPFVGAPLIPSRYGDKYLRGLVRTKSTQIYVTRGVGTITPPVRFRCRPEVVLITLT
ncbi:MAG: metallophosphoesterase [Deltaproteobacteria bacterium]|nr:metallophosphoesterase [Deltaproteobacteria bacterium]